MKVLLTHPGTQYAYALARQLQRLGILYRFATGLAWGEDEGRWLPRGFQRRVVAGVPATKLHRQPGVEVRALWRLRQGHDRQQLFYARNEHFQRQLPDSLLREADIVIGFDTASWILQERCARIGKPFVLDASIAHPLSREAWLSPLRTEFPALDTGAEAKHPRNLAAELQEINQAGHIVAASAFSRDTYLQQGVDPARISVNPYGVDLQAFRPRASPRSGPAGPVFAFLGAIGARKGIPWLWRVWPRLLQKHPGARLLIGGYGDLPAGVSPPAGVELAGFIHPADRLAFLHRADAFVFPSYYEGFAQVIVEAMAAGLPVITTAPTVGPELIRNGLEGYIVQPGDDAALLSALDTLAAHAAELPKMGAAARAAAEPYTWDAYGLRWQAILQQVLDK